MSAIFFVIKILEKLPRFLLNTYKVTQWPNFGTICIPILLKVNLIPDRNYFRIVKQKYYIVRGMRRLKPVCLQGLSCPNLEMTFGFQSEHACLFSISMKKYILKPFKTWRY